MCLPSLRAAASALSTLLAINATRASGSEETSPGSLVCTLYGRWQRVDSSMSPRASKAAARTEDVPISSAKTPSDDVRFGMLNFRRPFDRLCQPKPNRWGVAKLVRRLTLDQVILGSNPSAPAIVLSQDIEDACLKTLWTGQRPLSGW